MPYWAWSYLLTAVGVTGFLLAGKRVWWAWYVNLACQVLWAAYATHSGQWGFLIGTGVYSFVFTGNAIAWTREHRQKAAEPPPDLLDGPSPDFRVDSISCDPSYDGLTTDVLAAGVGRVKVGEEFWLSRYVLKGFGYAMLPVPMVVTQIETDLSDGSCRWQAQDVDSYARRNTLPEGLAKDV